MLSAGKAKRFSLFARAVRLLSFTQQKLKTGRGALHRKILNAKIVTEKTKK